MKREYFSSQISNFLDLSPNEILGELVKSSEFPVENTQRDAWLAETKILQKTLQGKTGKVYFEYAIPFDESIHHIFQVH